MISDVSCITSSDNTAQPCQLETANFDQDTGKCINAVFQV